MITIIKNKINALFEWILYRYININVLIKSNNKNRGTCRKPVTNRRYDLVKISIICRTSGHTVPHLLHSSVVINLLRFTGRALSQRPCVDNIIILPPWIHMGRLGQINVVQNPFCMWGQIFSHHPPPSTINIGTFY